MKFAVKFLVFIILTTSGFISVLAQQCSPLLPDTRQLPLNECRMIANGKGNFWDKDNAIGAGIRLFILGNKSDVVNPDPYGVEKVKTDVLIMSLSYYAPRKIIPLTVGLNLTSYSPTPSKYKSNHKLIIYFDNNVVLYENTEPESSIIFAERFYLSLKYTDFLKFTEAKNITIQFGDTKVKLNSEDIEALNELNKTTKELKQPPPPYI